MSTRPPDCMAFCIRSGMPSPTLRVVRVVTKGLRTRSTNSGDMPQPSSRTVIVRRPSAASAKPMSTWVAPAFTLF